MSSPASLLDVAQSPPAPPPADGGVAPPSPHPCPKCGSIEFYSHDFTTGRPKFCLFCNPPRPRSQFEKYVLVERQGETVCVKQADELRIMDLREQIALGKLSADSLPPKQVDFEDWWIAIGGFGVPMVTRSTPATTTTTTNQPDASKAKLVASGRQRSLLEEVSDLTGQ